MKTNLSQELEERSDSNLQKYFYKQFFELKLDKHISSSILHNCLVIQ